MLISVDRMENRQASLPCVKLPQVEGTPRIQAGFKGLCGRVMAKKKTHESAALPPLPLSELASMKALLATPQSPAGDKSTRKAKPKKKR
jgi:hypothetical protein